jgi:hypothetical protein
MRWQSFGRTPGADSMHQHKTADNCLYCKPVQYVSLGEAPPVKTWQRPVLLVLGIMLTACTVMSLQFAWERAGATFFAAVSVLVMLIALVGVAISFRGCDNCVARFLGKPL